MSTLAAILTALVEIMREWKNFALKAWRREGADLAQEIENAKSDDERSKLLDKLSDHINRKP